MQLLNLGKKISRIDDFYKFRGNSILRFIFRKFRVNLFSRLIEFRKVISENVRFFLLNWRVEPENLIENLASNFSKFGGFRVPLR